MLIYCLIPILFFVSLFVIVYSSCTDGGILTRTRVALIITTTISGLLVVVLTEGLSANSHITLGWLLAAWSIAAVAAASYISYKGLWRKAAAEIPAAIFRFIKESLIAKIITGFLFISLFIALTYPPNNYDSMTYHMARVAHWQQNHSISHYPTHVLRQLVYQPFAEWIILHLQVLTNSDRLANAVQLFFFAGCILGISLLTKELGGNTRQQKFSALFTCLIPMAVIQSNTTQNDIVVAYFVICFIFFTLRSMKGASFPLLLAAGISLGLSWLTKGTAYLYTLLFCGWYGLSLLKDYRQPLGRIIRKAALMAIIPLAAFLINSGHYSRNIFLTGSALGGKTNDNTTNKGFEPKQLAMVAFKNFLNHMPVQREWKAKLVSKSAEWGIDADNKDYNFITTDWMVEGFRFHEDYAQNFVHALLIIAVGFVFFFNKRLYGQPLNYYSLFVFTAYASFALFCVLLKWQPWSNRLETCLFMLLCIPMAMELSQARKWIQWVCILPMLGFGVAGLLYSSRHPLLPPGHSILAQPYTSFLFTDGQLECKQYLDSKPYTTGGIVIGGDTWDYPYYKLLAGKRGKYHILRHVLVNNDSRIYLDNFIPDFIISIEVSRDNYVLGGKTYYRTKVFKDGPAIFEPR